MKLSDAPTSFLIRIPAGLKTNITELARREHRSINQQIGYLLESALRITGPELNGSQPGVSPLERTPSSLKSRRKGKR